MQTRREFLGLLGFGAVGAALGCASGAPAPAPAARMPLGIQLYTLRTLLARDFEGTVARVAEIGYREVEFAGYFGRTPAQVRQALAAAGLTAPSAHIPFPANDAVWRRALDAAREIGHEWAVIPDVDPVLRRTPADWARVATALNALAPAATRAGLRLAYHNHDFELAPNPEGGTWLDLLVARTDPALVDFELDVYWVTKAGADPLALLDRYPGRFPLLHAKDATAAPERRMVDLGAGEIDFGPLLRAARLRGLRHLFVEHDEPADPLASARASFAHLATVRF